MSGGRGEKIDNQCPAVMKGSVLDVSGRCDLPVGHTGLHQHTSDDLTISFSDFIPPDHPDPPARR